jgi:hypothetical protein
MNFIVCRHSRTVLEFVAMIMASCECASMLTIWGP